MTPLWVCKETMASDHMCTYVVCSACYEIPKRIRKKSRKADDEGKSECEHPPNYKHKISDLKQFSSKDHYIAVKNNPNIPNVCSTCQRTIVVIG